MFKCSNIKINKYKFMVHLDCVVLICKAWGSLNLQVIYWEDCRVETSGSFHLNYL